MNSLKGLSDGDIESMLFNFDESDFEDFDDDEEEKFSTLQEDIPEEVLPRSPDGSEWDSSDEESLVSLLRVRRSTNRALRWDRTSNFQQDNSNLYEDPPLVEPTSRKPSHKYFYHYIQPEFFEQMSDCTNICSTHRTGRSLNTNSEEMRIFIGVSMVMGILGLPRMRMFWAAETRAALVANTITRNRFFHLRSNIKVVDDQLVSPSMKAVDRFWKIRPLVPTIEAGCRQNQRCQNVAIDEQIIPFTGKCKMKQVVRGKPNPEGIKVFLLANPNGLPLDLYLYQGGGTTVESALHPMPEKLDLGGRVVLKLVDTLPKYSSIYIDRYFTSVPLLDNLLVRNIYATGTLKKDRVSEYRRPNSKNRNKQLLKSDRTLVNEGRGSYDCIVRQDKTIAVVKWLDSKPIHLASTETAVEPLGSCRRWSKKEQQYIVVPQPSAIKNYNQNMGGIDLLDRIIGKYPMRGRTGKWTVRAILHFFDFAAAASWIKYREDAVKGGLPRKDIKQYLDFKMDLAKHLIFGSQILVAPQCSSPILSRVTRNSPSLSRLSLDSRFSPTQSRVPRDSPSEELGELNIEALPSQRKRKPVEPIPHVAKRLKEAKHLPVFVKGGRAKCRLSSCNQQTFVKCSDCNIFLCFNVNRNCFFSFHTTP